LIEIIAHKMILSSMIRFSLLGSRLRLRKYQRQVAQCIAESVLKGLGLSFVVIFPRQSGKNELQAQIEAYLLTLFSQEQAEIVKVSPTWKPQSLNAMRRLERILSKNLITRGLWKKESGYIYRVGSARIFFLSGAPGANIVGATASTLLECDEAQDVQPAKWDKDVAPMAASTNATRVFWGTAWTSRTLLAREARAAQEAEKRDGRRRVWILTADDVSKEVPAYGKFVAEQVAKMGRNHPLVKTQFFSEEIDAEGGMFPAARLALMQGDHSPCFSPEPGKIYALLVDVAGEDESAQDQAEEGAALRNPGRDSTALTVVEVDLSTLSDAVIQAPSYRVVDRCAWQGVKHSTLYGVIRGLAEHWRARYLVIDSTGVGAGLASFLANAFGDAADRTRPGGKVIKFTFTQKSKSELGWNFLSVVETGRYKEARIDHYASHGMAQHNGQSANPAGSRWQAGAPSYGPTYSKLQCDFWEQAGYCQSVVLDGPGKMMRWGVPDGTRSVDTGDLVHDDLVLSAALCAVLDEQEWFITAPAIVIPGKDPLLELDQEGF
jgi:hypothetical protein